MKLYTIKPLEWKPLGPNTFSAKTPLFTAWVWMNVDRQWHWARDGKNGIPCASLADGQAQAEACWQARLAGVLEEQR